MAELKATTILQRQKYKDKTYKLYDEKIEGFIDQQEALRQSIYKVLSTEQYEYPIYSFSYGIAWNDLLGNEQAYVRAEMKRMIEETLSRDDRIIELSDFNFVFSGDTCFCTFKVFSIFGELRIEKEVKT